MDSDSRQHTELLIIGGGAAGLMAARELALAGRQVVLLEARGRLGGRAHTCTPPGFRQPVEIGAEFIHGEAPLTYALLAEAGLNWQDTAGRTYDLKASRPPADADFFGYLPPLLKKMAALAQDMPLADFLAREFPGDEHAPLRTMAIQFAEGYDAADTQRASTWALRDEWAAGGADNSPRPVGGYGALLHWLAEQAQAAGATLALATPVQEICWQPGATQVKTTTGVTYHAQQVLCTVPLGVWQRTPGQPGYLKLVPDLPTHRAAATQLGFGAVIKILLEFKEPFWQDQLPDLDFLLSEAPVPTWWAQLPDTRPLLTGWLAGPTAEHLHAAPAETVLQLALESLAQLLASTPAALRQQLRASHIANWAAEPYAYGAYSYATVGAPAARAALAAPVADTLFFAGEGLFAGPEGGTVEAALTSGQAVAHAMLSQHAAVCS